MVIDILILTILSGFFSYITLLDVRHRVIWNGANLTIFAIAILYTISMYFRPEYFTLDLITSITSFILFSTMSVALFFVLGSENWGGGDAKMIIATSPLLFTMDGLFIYIVSLIVLTLALQIITKINKSQSMPYGPVIGYSVLLSLGVSLYYIHANFLFLVFATVAVSLSLVSIVLAKTIFKEQFSSWEVNIPEDAI